VWLQIACMYFGRRKARRTKEASGRELFAECPRLGMSVIDLFVVDVVNAGIRFDLYEGENILQHGACLSRMKCQVRKSG